MPSVNEQLIEAIKNRPFKKAEFNEGILTADRYVKTMQECVGSDLCYRFAAKGNVSFDDAIKRASNVLTYNNPEMVIEEQFDWSKGFSDKNGQSVELPKNTLMLFRHKLTTPRQDRDGDVLRTQGAKPDPKMLLLWQHVHTLPIGKLINIWDHTSQKLVVVSAIVDMNELCHDAAVMVDNKMGRFSHGFKALEYCDLKEDASNGVTSGGFDVKVFEILEESLVSVPSNVDADTEEVILSLVEGKQFKSELMKEYGKSIREHRPKEFNIPISFDVQVKVNGNETKSGKTPCGCTSKETNAGAKEEGKQTNTPEVEEVSDKGRVGDASESGIDCPQCGKAKLDTSGTCQQCGYILESGKSFKTDEKYFYGGYLEGSWEYVEACLESEAKSFIKSNTDVDFENCGYDYDCRCPWVYLAATYADYALVGVEWSSTECKYFKIGWETVDGKPKFSGTPTQVKVEFSPVGERRIKYELKDGIMSNMSSKQAMSMFLQKASAEEKQRMADILKTFEEVEKTAQRTKEFRPLLG